MFSEADECKCILPGDKLLNEIVCVGTAEAGVESRREWHRAREGSEEAALAGLDSHDRLGDFVRAGNVSQIL